MCVPACTGGVGGGREEESKCVSLTLISVVHTRMRVREFRSMYIFLWVCVCVCDGLSCVSSR